MLNFFISLVFLSVSVVHANAANIQASGIALIQNGDLDAARKQAISRATEQASLFAMAQIAVTQTVKDGILEIDNLRVNTQTTIGQIQVLSETRRGNQLEVVIQAEVSPIQGCADSNEATAYRKPIAITQWPIAKPSQANVGRLQSLAVELPSYLMTQLESTPHLKLIKAHQYQIPVYSDLSPDADRLRAQNAANLNAQYILSAQIDSMAMAETATDTPNVLVDLAETIGVKPRNTARFFRLSADLIDTQTGSVLQRYQLDTQGSWDVPLHSKEMGNLSSFAMQPYGTAVLKEIDNLAAQLSESLACEPLRATILSTQGDSLWIDKGSDAGLNPGDRLSVSRKVQLFNPQMQAITEIEPTTLSLVIERTEFNRSLGKLSQPSDLAAIQPGDIAIGN